MPVPLQALPSHSAFLTFHQSQLHGFPDTLLEDTGPLLFPILLLYPTFPSSRNLQESPLTPPSTPTSRTSVLLPQPTPAHLSPSSLPPSQSEAPPCWAWTMGVPPLLLTDTTSSPASPYSPSMATWCSVDRTPDPHPAQPHLLPLPAPLIIL